MHVPFTAAAGAEADSSDAHAGVAVRRWRRALFAAALVSFTSAILLAASLGLQWWSLDFWPPMSPADVTHVLGRVWSTRNCEPGRACVDTSAWSDQEATLKTGQLTAGAFFVASIVSCTLSAVIALANLRRAGGAGAGGARASGGAPDGPTATYSASLAGPLSQASDRRRVVLRVAARLLWAACLISIGTAVFVLEIYAWRDEYISPLPVSTTFTLLEGRACAVSAAVLAGITSVALLVAFYRRWL